MEEEDKIFYQGAGRRRRQPQARDSIEIPEGVFNQNADPNDTSSESFDRAVSLTKIRTSDLLSEGEIQGLVTGYYRYTSESGVTGYNSADFVRNRAITIDSETYFNLQSVYFNDVPLVDDDGKFNFQQINFTEEKGSPLPSTNTVINNPDGNGLSIVRNIQERLRGPNIIVNANGTTEIDPNVSEDTFAKYYRILNKQCSKAQINIRFNALFLINKTGPKQNPPGAPAGQGYGDTTSTSVRIRILIREIFSNSGGYKDSANFRTATTKTITGKITQGYLQAIPFNTGLTNDLLNDPTFLGFEIKVVRLTEDSINRDRSDQTTIDSLIEYYTDSFGYPSSAIVSCKFEAEYFSQIPARTFEVDLLKVKIPSNYDPILRTYDGDWDGTFAASKQWTDNPAWCYYDLLTNKRYGLGDQIPEELVDKWSIYEIAQYCDEMVPDGEGAYEPRFSCNAYFNDRLDAYTALQDFASIFRGMTYYAGGTIRAFQDRPSDPIYTFTNANVVDGGFSYQSTSRKARFNTAVVRYNDRFNSYLPAIEVVEDVDGIRRNGVIRKEITAFGITKKSQAARIGQWILLTDNLETETVGFTAGVEAAILEPGDVVKISDNTKNSKRLGGRIKDISGDANGTKITLDSEISLSGTETYEFSLVTPSYIYEPSLMTGAGELDSTDISGINRSQIQSFSFLGSHTSGETGSDNIVRTVITGVGNLLDTSSYEISGFYLFSISSNGTIDKNEEQLYRVISITESDTANEYSVNAVIYKQEKYNKADNSTLLENTSIYAVPPAPDSLALEDLVITDSDTRFRKVQYTVSLPNNSLSGIRSIAVYAKKSGIGDGGWTTGDFTQRGNTVSNQTPDSRYIVGINEASSTEVVGAYAPSEDGTYLFRAYSRNPVGTPSTTCVSGFITIDQGPVIESITISNLTLEENESASNVEREENETDEISPSFKWDQTFILDGSDSINVDLNTLRYRVTAREPSLTAIPSPIIYFEETGLSLEETVYQFTYAKNLSGAPVVATNGRPFSTYTEYNFPRASQKQDNDYFKTGFFPVSGQTGPFRQYDLVVEAHDVDGNSSVGYNIVSDSEGSGDSSVFSTKRADGYDILQVRNFGIDQVILTPDNHASSCRAAVKAGKENSFDKPYDPYGTTEEKTGVVLDDFNFNYPTATALGAESNNPTLWCTEQFLDPNGDLVIKPYRDSRDITDFSNMDISNVAGAIVYFSDNWFDSSKIKNSGFTEDAFGDQTITGVVSYRPNNKDQYPNFTSLTAITGDITKRGALVNSDASVSDEKITIPINIVSKGKYIAVSFLDKFEVEQITNGDTDQGTILDNAKNYSVSPTAFIKRRGEPDARTAFRAYFKIVASTQMTDRFGYASLNIKVERYKIFSYGFSDSFEISLSTNPSFNMQAYASVRNYLSLNGEVSQAYTILVTADLNESIPSAARVYLTGGQTITTENKGDYQVTVAALVYTAPNIHIINRDAYDNQYLAVYTYYYRRSLVSANYLAVVVDLSRYESKIVDTDILSVGILWNGLSANDASVSTANINTNLPTTFPLGGTIY